MSIKNGLLHLNAMLPRAPLARHRWYPVPGWIGDPLPRIGKFERWQRRSHAAQRLYWRTHPELYQQMLDRADAMKKRRQERERAE